MISRPPSLTQLLKATYIQHPQPLTNDSIIEGCIYPLSTPISNAEDRPMTIASSDIQMASLKSGTCRLSRVLGEEIQNT
jgi:hypothetical protein